MEHMTCAMLLHKCIILCYVAVCCPWGMSARADTAAAYRSINDARQLPIIIPQKETFESLQKLAADCISLKKVATTDDFLMGEKQYELNRLVRSLYGVEGFY